MKFVIYCHCNSLRINIHILFYSILYSISPPLFSGRSEGLPPEAGPHRGAARPAYGWPPGLAAPAPLLHRGPSAPAPSGDCPATAHTAADRSNSAPGAAPAPGTAAQLRTAFADTHAHAPAPQNSRYRKKYLLPRKYICRCENVSCFDAAPKLCNIIVAQF
jgi:hypothetical protein